jgi:hypothetical protein
MSDNPILPLDFITDVTKHTQMITGNRSNITTPTPLQVTNLPAEEYWTKLGSHSSYNKGVMLGTVGTSQTDLEAFMKLFKKTMEEIIRTELNQKEKTSEEFKDDFKILEHTYNNIIQKLKKTDVTCDNNRILATLHGFVNAFTGKVQNG